jgi:hypothetical protein
MIATPRFVFLHLHKSGGTFVNDVLLRWVEDARRVGYHLPRLLVPRDYAALPALGFVRNPWSWYVSWYSFQRSRPRPNALFRILSDDGRLEFEPTVRRLLDLGTGGPDLDRVLAALPNVYGSHGLNVPAFALAPIRGTRLGFYGYLERYVHGEPGETLHVGRMETLRRDLLDLLARVGQPVGADMRLQILGGEARNVSAHGAYAEYYSPSLRDLVAEREAGLIARFGYTFD